MSNSVRTPHTGSPLGSRGFDRRGIGRTEILVGVAVVAVVVLISVPLGLNMSKKSRRAEVPLNVDAIRTAEIEYQSAFSEFVAADAAPRPPHAVNAEAVPWAPSEGFKRLSWAPEQEMVRGSYSVQADRNGFTVTGACDVDGDGNRAIFTATVEQSAQMVSDSNIY